MTSVIDAGAIRSRARAASNPRVRVSRVRKVHAAIAVATIFGWALLCVPRAQAAAALMPATPATASATSGDFTPIPGSAGPLPDTPARGAIDLAQMSVEIVLAPSNAAQLSALLAQRSTPGSATYGQWLAPGAFAAQFGPPAAEVAAVSAYLSANGLTVEPSSSPFLLRAHGSSNAVAGAFRTTLNAYRDERGRSFFANASPIALPVRLAAGVIGVVGLANSVRVHPHYSRAARPQSGANCEAPYPTIAQLVAFTNNGTAFPFGYGGSPGCNGLTPHQENALYAAPRAGSRGRGTGVNLAVFELSAYQHSDIEAWARYFYGTNFHPPLTDIDVDGGPVHSVCPPGDPCASDDFSGDIEVDADIETQLAIAPEAHRILVYNAPGDTTGQTELDEYARIANDDTADVISSSWGDCENDTGAAYAQAENLIFEQMALQGQSMFGSAGDSGAFDCIGIWYPRYLNVDDPSSQPWVTSVGGTSFAAFNPGTRRYPSYPSSAESVWNVDGLCDTSADEGGHAGYFWCGAYGTGAGGGGSSQFWSRPYYQSGPGITNPFTTYGNGKRQCALGPKGAPCREVPDISANADEYTPYAEYCTATANTPNSSCNFEQIPFGWFGIGGTSLSSPLWSAIFADRDSYIGHRSGNANPLLYALYDLDPHGYFHDVTGEDQIAKNNGYFPTTPGYDLAGGIGTPRMDAIITGRADK